MKSYKILLVEDEDSQISLFEDAITLLNANKKTTELEIIGEHAKTIDDAKAKLKEDFNAVIIDLRLSGEPDNEDGSVIASEIISDYQIPAVIRTGTPEKVDSESPIDMFSRTDDNALFSNLIPFLMNISNTGIFKVLGGKGLLQKKLFKVFWENLYSKKDYWINIDERLTEKVGTDASSITEQLLLRYAVAHLQELLDNTPEYYFPEESYITPTLSSDIKTGNIKKAKKDDVYYIVLSPPYDLVLRSNGECKTDSILLCQIESVDKIHDSALS